MGTKPAERTLEGGWASRLKQARWKIESGALSEGGEVRWGPTGELDDSNERKKPGR